MTSNFEKPKTNPSALSINVTSTSSPSCSDNVVDSSRPPKPAPSTKTRITCSLAVAPDRPPWRPRPNGTTDEHLTSVSHRPIHDTTHQPFSVREQREQRPRPASETAGSHHCFPQSRATERRWALFGARLPVATGPPLPLPLRRQGCDRSTPRSHLSPSRGASATTPHSTDRRLPGAPPRRRDRRRSVRGRLGHGHET